MTAATKGIFIQGHDVTEQHETEKRDPRRIP